MFSVLLKATPYSLISWRLLLLLHKRLSSSNLCWMTYLYPPILLSLIKLLLNSLMYSLLGLVPIPILASVGSILLYNTGRYSSWMSEPRNDNLSRKKKIGLGWTADVKSSYFSKVSFVCMLLGSPHIFPRLRLSTFPN